MTFRDDEVAAQARVRALQKEITLVGRHPLADAARDLRSRIARVERRNRSAAAAMSRRRGSAGWLCPRSLTEVVVACALAATSLTIGLGVIYLALSLASIL